MGEVPVAPPGSSVAVLVESLIEIGCEYAGSVSGHTGKFTCPNPGHTDGHASFDVRVGRNGKAAFNCSPCIGSDPQGRTEWIEVLRDAGVRWSGNECEPEDVDWGPAADVVGGHGGRAKQREYGPETSRDVYTYRFKDGRLNFKVARINYESGAKRFVVRHVGKDGKAIYSLPPEVIRTPLGLEDFGIGHGKPVYIVEGEKAALALLKAGIGATTFHGGTNAPRHPRWPEWFAKFSEVRVWPDADEVGVDWAKALVLELREAGIKASLYGVVEGATASDDAFDWIARPGPRAALAPLTKGDLRRLSALKPKPVVSRSGSTVPVVETVVLADGRTISIESAGSVGGSGEGGDGTEGDEPSAPRARPYPYAINVKPYAFAKEVLRREWGLDSESGLTLRWQAPESTFWLWEPRKGHYVPLHPDEVVTLVVDRLDVGARETVVVDKVAEVRPINMKPKNTEDIIKGLKRGAIVSAYGAGALLPAAGGVPFRNGWLDATTGELLPLGPSRDVRWVVPADYVVDDVREPAEWLKFLGSIGYDEIAEEHRLLKQWFGYLLSGRTDLNKGLILVGPKRAGKGTVLRIAEELMGDGAEATSLERFDPQKTFGLSNLIGKSLATIGDARWGKNDAGRNAALLSFTGGDAMPSEKKNKDVQSLRATARLMIASNETPKFYEASDAMASRLLILEFTKSFYGSEDLGLTGRLISELPLIARWALDGLHDLMREGRFSETARGLEMQKSVARDASPVARFVDECCEVGAVANDKDKLWIEYKAWADDENVFAGTKSAFFSNLNAAFPGKFKATRIRSGAKRVQQIEGIRYVGD